MSEYRRGGAGGSCGGSTGPGRDPAEVQRRKAGLSRPVRGPLRATPARSPCQPGHCARRLLASSARAAEPQRRRSASKAGAVSSGR
jgi:hypothetical protein